MIILLVMAYSFMAGMVAEWSHTRQEELGFKNHILLTSFFAGVIWPVMIWRISR